MGINIFKGIAERFKKYTYAKMLRGSTPVFSQFGEEIYVSDVVKNCIRIAATEMSKLKPKHIRIRNGRQETVNSSINRLLRVSPNQLMTTSEFLEKCVWLWELKNNCFIYPEYQIVNGKRIYKGFYPLNPVSVDFLEDLEGILHIKLYFANGSDYTFRYKDIIHWRKDYSLNEFLGGDETGNRDNKELLKILKVNNTITEGLDKAVKSGLSINGVIKMNTMLDEEKMEKRRVEFEDQLKRSESGILAMDLKGEYVPISRNGMVVVDKNILEFIQSKVLNNFTTSLAIFTGDFTDEQYQAYYEQKLEAMINSLGQAFDKCLFTDKELDTGNTVIFYTQQLLFTNTKNKIAVAEILGNRGALTDNELLELFGYPPFDGGDTRHMSLNFIDRDIANSYQASRVGAGKGVKKEDE